MSNHSARIAGLDVTAQFGDFDGGALEAGTAWRMISVLRAAGSSVSLPG